MPRQPAVHIGLENIAVSDNPGCMEMTAFRGIITDIGQNTFDYVDGGVSTFETITVNGIEMPYGDSDGAEPPVVGQLTTYVCYRGRYYAWARTDCPALFTRDLIHDCRAVDTSTIPFSSYPGITTVPDANAPYPPGIGPCAAISVPNATDGPIFTDFGNGNGSWQYQTVGFNGRWTALHHDESTYQAIWSYRAAPGHFNNPTNDFWVQFEYDATTCCPVQQVAGDFSYGCSLGGFPVPNSEPLATGSSFYDWDGNRWSLYLLVYNHTGDFCDPSVPPVDRQNPSIAYYLYRDNVLQTVYNNDEGSPAPHFNPRVSGSSGAGGLDHNGNDIWLWDAGDRQVISGIGLPSSFTYDTGGLRFRKVGGGSGGGFAVGSEINLPNYSISYFGTDIGPAADLVGCVVNPITLHPDGGFWFTGSAPAVTTGPNAFDIGLIGYIGPKGVHYATGPSHGLTQFLSGNDAYTRGIQHIFPNGDIIHNMGGDLSGANTLSGVARVTEDGIFPVDVPDSVSGVACIPTHIHVKPNPAYTEYITWRTPSTSGGTAANNWFRGYIDSNPTASYPISLVPL